MIKTVLIAGGSGFVGRKLSSVLKERGLRVYKLSRKKTKRRGYTSLILLGPILLRKDGQKLENKN